MTLRLEGVTVRYGSGAGALTAVDTVDLEVPKGRTLGLVGESGCGKSTIARAIVGLVPIVSGRLLLDGVDHTAERSRSSRAFRSRVQMIFQDPYSSLNPRMSVSDSITEVLALRRDVPRSTRRNEALRILELVRLPASALTRYPHQFSGGQRQRIAIARALAVKPDIIVNDEVTSALDVSVQANVLNLLRELQRELGLSYLFISHDLSTVRYMSDSVAVMYLGRVVEDATTEDLFRAPTHPYTRALIASIPKLGEKRRPAPVAGDLPDPRHPPSGCRFHTRCPIGPLRFPDRTVCVEQDPQAIAGSKPHRAACHFAGEQEAPVPAGSATA
jgi:peptide/nickel transport system ATP-binding protein